MALRKQICRTFDFELQAAATDDGLNFSLGPSLSFPLEDVFSYVSARNAEEVVMQAVFQAPLFGVRWRWDAARSLAVLRHTGGRKVPLPLLRMRSEDLLAAVFPAQVACQDNAPPGDIEPPDHPLVFETIRDCLTEAMDAAGLKETLTAIEQGEIEVYARDTVQPSVFSHQLLNTMPYAFLDDAPLEERRSRAVPLRRALPEDTRDLGALDPDAIAEESNRAWPTIRDADELHDALLHLIALPVGARLTRERLPGVGDGAGLLDGWFQSLIGAGRAFRLHHADGKTSWVATERVKLALAVYPDSRLEPPPQNGLAHHEEIDRDEAIYTLLRGWIERSGPFTTDEMSGDPRPVGCRRKDSHRPVRERGRCDPWPLPSGSHRRGVLRPPDSGPDTPLNHRPSAAGGETRNARRVRAIPAPVAVRRAWLAAPGRRRR